MKLKAIKLSNFRSYQAETVIPIHDFTAFVGRNEAGKSTILEALELFFNSEIVKIDQSDCCVHSAEKNVSISCIFTDLPVTLTVDAGASTSLEQEYLLNQDADLEIRKTYNCALKSPKESIVAIASHPGKDKMGDLLLLKNSELKSRLKELNIDGSGIDKRINSEMRKAIWASTNELEMGLREIPLDKEDAKAIWGVLSKSLPVFALFQADRKSTHEDREVQDPMAFAVTEALREVEQELENVKNKVEAKVLEVAARTLSKLKEMDPGLADQLTPRFKSDPKWSSLFKLTLDDHDQIPIDKRGSGARRLILLNFFRAEAERRQTEINSPGVIYAIEEPETSQHPSNQRLVIESLIQLSETPNSQVIVTTHVPGLAGLIPIESLRFLEKTAVANDRVQFGADDIYKKIANSLGVLPDKRVKVLLFVEGPNDVAFLKGTSKILNGKDSSLPDLGNDNRIVFVPAGGSTLQDWVAAYYLKGLNLPEVHIYDRDDAGTPKYQGAVDEVNNRGNGDFAILTTKREMENYIHPDAIQKIFGVTVTFNDEDDVPMLVAERVHEESNSPNAWNTLDAEKRGKKESKAKKRLNREAVVAMTLAQLEEIDSMNEIEGWIKHIANHLNN